MALAFRRRNAILLTGVNYHLVITQISDGFLTVLAEKTEKARRGSLGVIIAKNSNAC